MSDLSEHSLDDNKGLYELLNISGLSKDEFLYKYNTDLENFERLMSDPEKKYEVNIGTDESPNFVSFDTFYYDTIENTLTKNKALIDTYIKLINENSEIQKYFLETLNVSNFQANQLCFHTLEDINRDCRSKIAWLVMNNVIIEKTKIKPKRIIEELGEEQVGGQPKVFGLALLIISLLLNFSKIEGQYVPYQLLQRASDVSLEELRAKQSDVETEKKKQKVKEQRRPLLEPVTGSSGDRPMSEWREGKQPQPTDLRKLYNLPEPDFVAEDIRGEFEKISADEAKRLKEIEENPNVVRSLKSSPNTNPEVRAAIMAIAASQPQNMISGSAPVGPIDTLGPLPGGVVVSSKQATPEITIVTSTTSDDSQTTVAIAGFEWKIGQIVPLQTSYYIDVVSICIRQVKEMIKNIIKDNRPKTSDLSGSLKQNETSSAVAIVQLDKIPISQETKQRIEEAQLQLKTVDREKNASEKYKEEVFNKFQASNPASLYLACNSFVDALGDYDFKRYNATLSGTAPDITLTTEDWQHIYGNIIPETVLKAIEQTYSETKYDLMDELSVVKLQPLFTSINEMTASLLRETMPSVLPVVEILVDGCKSNSSSCAEIDAFNKQYIGPLYVKTAEKIRGLQDQLTDKQERLAQVKKDIKSIQGRVTLQKKCGQGQLPYTGIEKFSSRKLEGYNVCINQGETVQTLVPFIEGLAEEKVLEESITTLNTVIYEQLLSLERKFALVPVPSVVTTDQMDKSTRERIVEAFFGSSVPKFTLDEYEMSGIGTQLRVNVSSTTAMANQVQDLLDIAMRELEKERIVLQKKDAVCRKAEEDKSKAWLWSEETPGCDKDSMTTFQTGLKNNYLSRLQAEKLQGVVSETKMFGDQIELHGNPKKAVEFLQTYSRKLQDLKTTVSEQQNLDAMLSSSAAKVQTMGALTKAREEETAAASAELLTKVSSFNVKLASDDLEFAELAQKAYHDFLTSKGWAIPNTMVMYGFYNAKSREIAKITWYSILKLLACGGAIAACGVIAYYSFVLTFGNTLVVFGRGSIEILKNLAVIGVGGSITFIGSHLLITAIKYSTGDQRFSDTTWNMVQITTSLAGGIVFWSYLFRSPDGSGVEVRLQADNGGNPQNVEVRALPPPRTNKFVLTKEGMMSSTEVWKSTTGQEKFPAVRSPNGVLLPIQGINEREYILPFDSKTAYKITPKDQEWVAKPRGGVGPTFDDIMRQDKSSGNVTMKFDINIMKEFANILQYQTDMKVNPNGWTVLEDFYVNLEKKILLVRFKENTPENQELEKFVSRVAETRVRLLTSSGGGGPVVGGVPLAGGFNAMRVNKSQPKPQAIATTLSPNSPSGGNFYSKLLSDPDADLSGSTNLSGRLGALLGSDSDSDSDANLSGSANLSSRLGALLGSDSDSDTEGGGKKYVKSKKITKRKKYLKSKNITKRKKYLKSKVFKNTKRNKYLKSNIKRNTKKKYKKI